MTDQTITNPADWRAGDHAEGIYAESSVTPPVKMSGALTDGGGFSARALFLGPVAARYHDLTAGRSFASITVTRPGPTLPTEPGLVITNATIRGVPGCTAIRHDGTMFPWMTPTPVGGYYGHAGEHITAWTEADITPRGPRRTVTDWTEANNE
jgi:hypothetical protein